METPSLRYAPSPTGVLHVGNLRTAWISYRLAELLGYRWQVRFEDIDAPRVVPGAQEQQLGDLLRLGLKPKVISVQSEAHARHRQMFEKARAQGALYPCTCSRREVKEALQNLASAPQGASSETAVTSPVYSGSCRPKTAPADSSASRDPPAFAASGSTVLAWRFRDPDDSSGTQDFIVARTESEENFTPAYNWACALDDWDEAHALIVRAYDLKELLLSQRKLQRLFAELEGKAPRYPGAYHCALVLNSDGRRLEKRSRGVTLPELEKQGLDPSVLLRAFEQSFAAPTSEELNVWKSRLEPPAREKLDCWSGGEKNRELRLGPNFLDAVPAQSS